MKGFRDFVLRGNLIELAVAFIVGAAFAGLVKSFTEVLLEAIGKVFGSDTFDFSTWQPWGWTTIGPFLTALVAFVIMAFVVYFFIVTPYEKAKATFFPAEPESGTIDPNTELLREIRDELRVPRV